MIKKLKKKIILILTIIFFLILIGILLVINISNYRSNWSNTRRLLSIQKQIAEEEREGAASAPQGTPEQMARIYSVLVLEDESYQTVFNSEDSGYTDEQLVEIAKEMAAQQKEEGSSQHFRYLISEEDSGRLISFIDNSIWKQQEYRLRMFSLLIGAGGMIILFLAAVLLANWLIRPVAAAFDKQKQFISDAGHELKTPLAVMKASLDMLEDELENNKYLGYIVSENNRMTGLVQELLTLSSMETEEQIHFEGLDFSMIVKSVSLPFESIAFEKGIEFTIQIPDKINLHGNENQMSQVIEILLDNAMKHTAKGGKVQVILEKQKGQTALLVRNEGEPIPEAEQAKIFDRFYRRDKARNRNEGRYGLGLAIADSIIKVHKGTIHVKCRDGWTEFIVRV